MNIGDGQSVGGLFERIENAYQEGKLSGGPVVAESNQSGINQGEAAEQGSRVSRLEAPNPKSWERLEHPVQRGLLEICSDAINGRFESEDELRRSVVQTIVEQRYSQPLSEAKADEIMQTLNATLSTDPSFREGVEHLLVLAARELA